MSDRARAQDPGSVWRGQPEEKRTVNLEQIVNRRTQELRSSTRSETLMSIAAAVVFVGVMAWRFAPNYDGPEELGLAAAVAWVAISLYWFRRLIRRQDPVRPDAVAASGLDYYRGELERRRDHLRNPWIWNGPLLLACLGLVAVLYGKWFSGSQRLRDVGPLVVLLAVWTGWGSWRRRCQANQIQREIDQLENPGSTGPFERPS
jgi:hypothetical protein